MEPVGSRQDSTSPDLRDTSKVIPHSCHWTEMPPAGQSHNRRQRRCPLDPSLAVAAAVGALSATLALAFTTPPLAPHTHTHTEHVHHHDRCHRKGGGPPDGYVRSRQHNQRYNRKHSCCSSREAALSSLGFGSLAAVGGSISVASRRRPLPQQQYAAGLFGHQLGAVGAAGMAAAGGGGGGGGACFLDTAVGSLKSVAGNRRLPTSCLYASSRKEEAMVVNEEHLEAEEDTSSAIQQQDRQQQHQHQEAAAAAAVAKTSDSNSAKENGGGRASAAMATATSTQKKKRRRPPTYWASDENLRKEVVKFWADLGVTSNKVRSGPCWCAGPQ